MEQETLRKKIDKAIEIDKRMKKDKAELDSLKAEIQACGLEEMDNKGLKYVEKYGTTGNAVVTYKETIEIDNFNFLKALGEAVADKVKREESVKYTIDSKLNKALLAITNKNFKQHDIPSMLADLGLDINQIKVAMKKLKGDYTKDKAVLESLGLKGKLEEELDYIKENINFDVVSKFFDPDNIDKELLNRAITVKNSISIGLNYEG